VLILGTIVKSCFVHRYEDFIIDLISTRHHTGTDRYCDVDTIHATTVCDWPRRRGYVATLQKLISASYNTLLAGYLAMSLQFIQIEGR